MKKTFIYALCEPSDKRVVYIGRAGKPRSRLSAHLGKAQTEATPKAAWIREVLSQETRPHLEILDEVPAIEGNFWEKEYISLYRILGFTLLNSNDGGSGPTTHSEETKRKIVRLGCKHRPETRIKMSIASLGKPKSPTHRRSFRKKKLGASSGYHGVGWYLKSNRWSVRVCVDSKIIFVGYFLDEIEAAKAYDTAAKSLCGELAVLNFPKN